MGIDFTNSNRGYKEDKTKDLLKWVGGFFKSILTFSLKHVLMTNGNLCLSEDEPVTCLLPGKRISTELP